MLSNWTNFHHFFFSFPFFLYFLFFSTFCFPFFFHHQFIMHVPTGFFKRSHNTKHIVSLPHTHC